MFFIWHFPLCGLVLLVVGFLFSEDQAVFIRQDSGRNEKEISQVTHESEPDSGAQPRPAVSSGYSKQFQKSLPPRFQRQQVTDQFIKGSTLIKRLMSSAMF